jgi:hypothetical protein
MYECVHCLKENSPVIWHDPGFLVGRSVPSTLAPLAPTLEDRLDSWLRGENLLDAANQRLIKAHQH